MPQIEPATPPASLLREEAAYDGAESQAGTSTWEGSPKVSNRLELCQHLTCTACSYTFRCSSTIKLLQQEL